MEKNSSKSQEIDLIELLKKIISGRKIIYKYFIITLILGLIFALITPKMYTSNSVFVPMISSSSSGGGGLSGLASLAGINLTGSMEGSDIAPNLYPEIVESITFRQELSEVKIPYNGNFITYHQYYNLKSKSILSQIKKYTIGLPSLLFKSIKGNNPNNVLKYLDSNLIYITDDDAAFYKQFDKLVEINVDLKEGFIELSVNFDNPVGAAIIAKKAVEILQKKVIEYKIKQASEVLKYTQQQQQIKKELLYDAQSKLSSFKDRNIFISTATFQNQLMRLESEYNNANVVYQEVSKQVEESKLQVSKDTPIFTILKPVVVPNLSSNNKLYIIFLWIIIGLLGSITDLLFSKNIKLVFNRLKNI